MHNQTFDEQMKRRAQRESFTPAPKAQHSLAQAMQKGAGMMKQNRPQWSWQRIMAYAAAAAMLIAGFLAIQPPDDPWKGSAVLANDELSATPVPVTVPEAALELTVSNRMLHADASFENHTGDIWLIQWQASPKAEVQSIKEPTQLIWLETGIRFTDSASWKLTGGFGEQETDWSYCAYRVAARMLHWIEGEWLLPGSEGYEQQQMLMEDAFVNGALILAPGDWPEGTSGEMQLVLPDRFQNEHPETDALSYYVETGLLCLEAQGQKTAQVRKTE